MQAVAENTDALNDAVAQPLTLDEDLSREAALQHCNELFADMSAEERVAWSLKNLPARPVLSSSFGAQAAVSLHLVTSQQPDIPVIFVDTGYLFPETYQFVDELTDRLDLNLHVYRSKTSPAWQEARHGKRWLQGVEGIAAYNYDNKVEPMERALRELEVGVWFAGLRRNQSDSRTETPFLNWSGNGARARWKVHAIADWSDKDVYNYLQKHDLPYHPLWEKGYVSVGDVHTTKPLHEVEREEDTRFFGLTRECGLHDIDLSSV
ncbi:MAG: phosphoadenylyl-sulfate reductase [Gammaproteobacteria bacterium]|nr:phosphoadenylyl-sulfate reductase [Gammaproteobacteria bacterium]